MWIPLTNTRPIFRTLDDWHEDERLISCISDCVAEQKRVAATFRSSEYQPNPDGLTAVSPEALSEILRKGRAVNSVSRDPETANVICFHMANHHNSVIDRRVFALRRKLNRIALNRLRRTFRTGFGWRTTVSGHFWYPPGGYMSWHTNTDVPCWRIYLSHAEESGRSFFRYRDPDTGEIITSLDSDLDVRMFLVSRDAPFWHAVYSDTDRFSFGYRILPRRPLRAVARHLRRLVARGKA